MRNLLQNTMHNTMKGAILAMMVAVAACNSAGPTSVLPGDGTTATSKGSSGGSLTFLSAVTGAPPLTMNPVSFYAVQGQDRIAEITYQDPQGGGGSTTKKFLRLRIRTRTQIIRPDGSLLAAGDSILITMTVLDASKQITQFEPSGLRFTGKDPAVLTMWFIEADHDFNHDGVINSADLAIESTFSIFRQESNSAPWIRVQSTVSTDLDQVVANIPGFTNYVIAY